MRHVGPSVHLPPQALTGLAVFCGRKGFNVKKLRAVVPTQRQSCVKREEKETERDEKTQRVIGRACASAAGKQGSRKRGARKREEAASSSITPLFYSHSIVAGGFDDTSYTTRLMPLTSLITRVLIFPSSPQGSGYQSAVMKSLVATARRASTRS